MKRLWCALITRGDGGWWKMNTSEGDPPIERSFLYRFNVLLEQLHRLMENTMMHRIVHGHHQVTRVKIEVVGPTIIEKKWPKRSEC
jgi:hypothetical protein